MYNAAKRCTVCVAFDSQVPDASLFSNRKFVCRAYSFELFLSVLMMCFVFLIEAILFLGSECYKSHFRTYACFGVFLIAFCIFSTGNCAVPLISELRSN